MPPKLQQIIDYITAYRDGLITEEECRNNVLVTLCDIPVKDFIKFLDAVDLNMLAKGV